MGPLDGVRVVEFGLGIVGPYAAMLLADMGADVVKVEPPTGDINRAALVSEGDYQVGSQFYACNRNKRVVCLNLQTADGLIAAKKLIAKADVLVENMRGGVMDRLGLSYESLRTDDPRLIYASASGYGPKGPRAEESSLDIIAQAAGGVAAHTGLPETGPLPAGTALADHAGAVWTALGVMFALYGRQQTGAGQRVQTSLLGSQIGMQAWELSHFLLNGADMGAAGKGHPLAGGIWRVFDAADGSFSLTWVTDDRWAALCQVLDQEPLATDARFSTGLARLQNSAALIEILVDVFASWSLADLLPKLEATGQVFSKVMDYADLAADPQVLDNDYITSFQSPDYGLLRMVGFPVALSETPAEVRSRPPDLDQHTAEVLAELGYDDSEIATLFASGSVGHPTD